MRMKDDCQRHSADWTRPDRCRRGNQGVIRLHGTLVDDSCAELLRSDLGSRSIGKKTLPSTRVARLHRLLGSCLGDSGRSLSLLADHRPGITDVARLKRRLLLLLKVEPDFPGIFFVAGGLC